MSLRNHIGALLHGESFSAEPFARDSLKRGLVDERLRLAFAGKQYALGTNPHIEPTNPRRWRLIDGNNGYLVKDLGDRINVICETSPTLCGVIESAIRSKAKYYNLRWRARQIGLQYRWTARKRLVEKPQKRLVNIGSGSWYVPDWRILEYRGPWYNFYAPGFIDYPHNLTSIDPLPFSSASVDLFYSEHVVEHLKDEWCMHLFREIYRSLKPGGGFRVVMPDADLIYRKLIERDTVFFKSWMERDNSTVEEAFCTLVAQSRPLEKSEIDRRLAVMNKHAFLDWCKQGLDYDWHRAGEHINWFDFEKLAQMLRAAGFSDVRRTEEHQSRFDPIQGPKFDTRGWYSLHVDCVKN
jgi:SAM-dependent methyltransferase